MQRPSVDFPQPDSPTRPSTSPSAISRSTPSTACTTACSSRRKNPAMPLRSGKCLTRPRTSSSGSATGDHGLPAHVLDALLRMDARCRAVGANGPEREIARRAVRLHEWTARMEPAARRRCGEIGRRARDRRQRLPDEVDIRHRPQQAQACTGVGARERPRRWARSRPPGPRTSPRRAGTSGRPPRGRERRRRR